MGAVTRMIWLSVSTDHVRGWLDSVKDLRVEGKSASIQKTSTKKIVPGVEIDTEWTMRFIISENTCFPPAPIFFSDLTAHNWLYLSNEIYSSFSLFSSAWTIDQGYQGYQGQ